MENRTIDVSCLNISVEKAAFCSLGRRMMILTQQQIDTLKIWMRKKGVTPNCPACGASNQLNPGQIISAPEFRPGVVRMGGNSVPKAQLVCGNCAYVMEFAAAAIGLSNPPPEKIKLGVNPHS
jgi:hypothetical protein